MSGLKRVGARRDDALSRVSWDRLESLLAAYYRDRGFEVDEVGTGATGSRFDGGVDLRLSRDEERILLQCKHWNAMKVPHNAVHELLGVMVNEGATAAILVTSGEFSQAAIEAANRHGHVQLIDGDALRRMLGPLPEPPVAQPPVATDGLVFQPFDDVAGAHLVLDPDGRVHRPHERRHRRSAADATLSVTLLKLGLAVLLGLLVVTIFGFALQSVLHGLTHRRHLPAAALTGGGGPQVAAPSVPSEVDPWTAGRIEPSPVALPPAQTPEEIREQQRKATEAMKTIEKSTPEMQLPPSNGRSP